VPRFKLAAEKLHVSLPRDVVRSVFQFSFRWLDAGDGKDLEMSEAPRKRPTTQETHARFPVRLPWLGILYQPIVTFVWDAGDGTEEVRPRRRGKSWPPIDYPKVSPPESFLVLVQRLQLQEVLPAGRSSCTCWIGMSLCL